MKKLYVLLSLLTTILASAQIINFPDVRFKTMLLAATPTNTIAKNLAGTYFRIDANNDGQIEVAEAIEVSYLDIHCVDGCTATSFIFNLTGIEYFTNLKYLDCIHNGISTLPLAYLSQLEVLKCDVNSFSTIDLTGMINLKNFSCSSNALQTINLSGCPNLEVLGLSSNYFQTVNLAPVPHLKELGVSQNYSLSTLNLSGLTNLQELFVGYTAITNLNLSGLSQLRWLDCRSTAISSLNLNALPNLENLYAPYCQFTSLDFSACPLIASINCQYNSITNLNVSGCNHLSTLECYNNQISSLDITSDEIGWVTASNNQLTTLDLTGKPLLERMECMSNNLQSLLIKGSIFTDPDMGDFFDDFKFSGNPNLQFVCCDTSRETQVQARVQSYGYSNCVVNSYCSFTPGGIFYTIYGAAQFDLNNDGCDVSDSNLPFINFSISNESVYGTFMANASGNYSIPVQAATHLVTPLLENPTYYTISPSSASINFPAQTSPFTQNFCISANGVHNDLETILLPIIGARPGFDALYKIISRNKGTTVQNASLNLVFDDAILDFVSATPTIASQTANTLIWDLPNLQPLEAREITVTLNVNSSTETPAVNSGDVLNYTASVTGNTDETPNDNSSVLNQLVVNSLDPNDKTCLEGNTVSPEMIGQYVHYIIRFENTGTANAVNVVVKDVIDTNKFDISSLIPLNGSHPFVTRVNSTNKVEFIFENIQLPFDDEHNDGYVAFKIKTKPTLVLGDTFSNSANIYFDYNAPIVTNTATTTIQTLGNSDFNFNTTFTLSPVPAKNSLTISTKQSIIISSVSIYNTLGQLIQVNTNPNEVIDVSSLKSGSYFITVLSDKGKTSSKFIKE